MSEITPARPTLQANDSVGDTKYDTELKVEGLDHVEGGNRTDALTSLEGAAAAELAEQSMTFREAIRDYPAAVFWSFAISLCIIMEGYDTALPVSHHIASLPGSCGRG